MGTGGSLLPGWRKWVSSVQQFRPCPPKATDIKTEICPVPMATWEQASNKAKGGGGGG